jgi:amidase
LRIAWLGDFGGEIPYDPGVLELARSAMRVFEDLGCVVEEAQPDFAFAPLWRAFLKLRHWHNAPLLPLYEDPASRALLPEAAIYEIENGHAALTQFHQRYDFWALPTAQCFAFPAEARGAAQIGGRRMATYHEWMQCAVPATMAGAPALALPAGFDAQGRAMGVQLVGRVQDETAVLALARAYDEATRWPYSRPPDALAG